MPNILPLKMSFINEMYKNMRFKGTILTLRRYTSTPGMMHIGGGGVDPPSPGILKSDLWTLKTIIVILGPKSFEK